MVANEKTGEHGKFQVFGALCTALSATIGTGNIVGVATALVAGVTGCTVLDVDRSTFGTATKYAECLLAIKFRVVEEDGHVVGGPFYYIENGMGENGNGLHRFLHFLV